jgi:hypothetical protein
VEPLLLTADVPLAPPLEEPPLEDDDEFSLHAPAEVSQCVPLRQSPSSLHSAGRRQLHPVKALRSQPPTTSQLAAVLIAAWHQGSHGRGCWRWTRTAGRSTPGQYRRRPCGRRPGSSRSPRDMQSGFRRRCPQTPSKHTGLKSRCSWATCCLSLFRWGPCNPRRPCSRTHEWTRLLAR